MSFSKQLAKFNDKAIGQATKFKRAVGVELFSSVILDTPVDTGRARGNWQTTTNTPATGETNQTAAEATAKAGNPGSYGALEDVNYLTNNLPYIEGLEMGRSGQAPAGMVRKNLVRVRGILNRLAREARK
jgi:hypothetical protein